MDKDGTENHRIKEGQSKAGDQAVFQCGRNILRGKIISKNEGNLSTLLSNLNFKEIIPTASSVAEAMVYIKNCTEQLKERLQLIDLPYLGESMKRTLRMKCPSCGHWNCVPVNKLFVEQPSPEPKVKVMIPVYEPLEMSKCKKCGRPIAEQKNL